MKAIVQRVKKAHVTVDNTMISSIETGLVVLLGVAHGDKEKDAVYLVDKVMTPSETGGLIVNRSKRSFKSA